MLNNPNSFIIPGIIEDSVWYKGRGLMDKPRLSSKPIIYTLAKEFKSAKYVQESDDDIDVEGKRLNVKTPGREGGSAPSSNRNIAWKTGALTVLSKAKRE
jgi:hypothetical protein